MFSGEYKTEMSAQELVAGLMAVYTEYVTEEYLSVTLVGLNKPTQVIQLKLVDAIGLANGGEVLHCITDNDKKVDFLIPFPTKDRADGFLTAIALTEDDA